MMKTMIEMKDDHHNSDLIYPRNNDETRKQTKHSQEE